MKSWLWAFIKAIKNVSCVRNPTAPLTSEKPQFPNLSFDTCVSDLVDERSVIIFQWLNLSLQDIRLLTYSRDKWCEFDEYKKFKMLINDLKVVNDVAERGVRLMEEFKNVVTDDEVQRRMLLHCVEDTRKLYPDFRKSTLAKTHWTYHFQPWSFPLWHVGKGIKKQRNLNDGQHLDVVFRL